MSTGEIRRLQQDLLQRRTAGVNIFEPQNIDRIRLLQTQLLAKQVPVSKKLLKEQKKKKKKARKKKQLRGDLARNLRERRRFEQGEFREKDTDEPRIVGDPDPKTQAITVNIPGLAAALAAAPGGALALAPPAPARRVARRGSLPDLRPGLRALGDDGRGRARVERDIADPIAEAVERQRQAHDDFRGDVGEFARAIEQRDVEFRRQLEEQRAQFQDRDEYLRQERARTDAIYAELEERFGNDAVSLAEARARVEALEARERARLDPAARPRPADYDSVIIDAADDSFRDFDVEEFERSAREGLGLSPATTAPIRSPGLSLVEATPRAGERVEDISAISDEWASSYRQAQEASSNRVDEGYIQSVREHILGGGDPPDTLRPPRRLTRSPEGPRRDVDNPFFAEQQPSPFSSPARPNTPESLSPEPARIGGGGELDLPAIEIGDVSALEASALSTGLDLPVSRAAQRAQERLEAGTPLPGDEERVGRSALEESAPGLELEEQEESQVGLGVSAPERFRLTTTQEPGFPEFDQPGRIETVEEDPPQRVIEPAGIQAVQQPVRELDPEVLVEAVEEAEEVGNVLDARQQRVRDSQTLFEQSQTELLSNVRPGPRADTGQRGGLGYRVRNNTDKKLKKIEPGDVQNVFKVEGGTERDPSPKYRLDSGQGAGTRTKVSQLQPLIASGELLFEKGHRHELGGHFDEQPYGPPPTGEQTVEALAAEVEARVEPEALQPEPEPAEELEEGGGGE